VRSCALTCTPTPADFSQRLVVEPATEWREHDGTLRTLEARTLLDACYLQLGAAKKARSRPHTPCRTPYPPYLQARATSATPSAGA
jgi:hypothetical protein